MGEFVKVATDILSTVLPDSDLGKIGALAVLGLFVLVLAGRIKLEWLGYGSRHICRWLRCKISDKHRYFQDGIGWMDMTTGRRRGTFVCEVCGKVMVIR